MNTYLLIGGLLCFLLGIVHSILGEYLIFSSKRAKGSLVPSKGNADLKERHLRIIWATWHLASVFGWCIGAILIKISMEGNELNLNTRNFILQSIMYTMFFYFFFSFNRHQRKTPRMDRSPINWSIIGSRGLKNMLQTPTPVTYSKIYNFRP